MPKIIKQWRQGITTFAVWDNNTFSYNKFIGKNYTVRLGLGDLNFIEKCIKEVKKARIK
jgi:hypothetical protein